MILISDRVNKLLKSDNWGNIIFWLSFCVVGQVRGVASGGAGDSANRPPGTQGSELDSRSPPP